jgi:hypothetical protein
MVNAPHVSRSSRFSEKKPEFMGRADRWRRLSRNWHKRRPKPPNRALLTESDAAAAALAQLKDAVIAE